MKNFRTVKYLFFEKFSEYTVHRHTFREEKVRIRSAFLGFAILASLVSAPVSALNERVNYEAMTQKYLLAYRGYLQAKMNQAPDAPVKLKAYNDAFADYLKALKDGALTGTVDPSPRNPDGHDPQKTNSTAIKTETPNKTKVGTETSTSDGNAVGNQPRNVPPLSIERTSFPMSMINATEPSPRIVAPESPSTPR